MFLLRSGRSAIMLCLMVIAAVSALIFLSSLAVGVNDAMIRNSVGMFSGHITGFSIPQSITPESLKISGVDGVLKRVYVPGTIANGDRVEAVNLAGIYPDAERKLTAFYKKKIKGHFVQLGEQGVYLSSLMCEELNADLGDALVFRSGLGDKVVKLKITGIYNSGLEELDNNTAFCAIDILPEAITATWSAAIFLKDGIDPDKIINEYAMEHPGLVFKSWRDLMPDLIQLIDLNYVSMNIVMLLVFCVVSVGISCAFAIFILKNMREYGIMKSMGVTPAEVGSLIMIEIFLINIAASLSGIIIGLIAVYIAARSGIDLTSFTSHNKYFSVSGVIFPRLTFYSLFLPPFLAMVFSLISGIWPTLLVSRKKAVHILRSH